MKQVLITGGTRGIGKAIAELLAADYEIFAPGSKEMDISNPEAIDAYFKKHQLKPDILINNAGVHITKPFIQHSETDWQKIFDINLHGAVRVSKAAVEHMQAKQWGRIINISSISGLEGEPNASAYSASKFALVGLTKSLASEFAKDKITINAVCPGWVKTDMTYQDDMSKEKEAMILGSVPQQRWIEPQEIAQMVKYLISEEAQAVTGQALSITAGLDL